MGLNGIPSTGIENNPRFFRLFQQTVARLELPNVAAMFATITTTTTQLVPPADAVFFLAVWHHAVRSDGMDAATSLLEAIWKRTGVVLFFETGEVEMPADYRLPDMSANPTEFVGNYLSSVCTSGTITHLGRHDAFAPDGQHSERGLFAVTRA
jgi:hypothetical protein